ncbi:hypothetical protein BJV74DRAFT_870096, partial [Russula compacta]
GTDHLGANWALKVESRPSKGCRVVSHAHREADPQGCHSKPRTHARQANGGAPGGVARAP